MGLIINLVFFGLIIYIAYLVITLAVRHGIDNSEVGKMLKKQNRNRDSAGNLNHKDDLDNDY